MKEKEIKKILKDFKELPFSLQYLCFESFIDNHTNDLEYYKALIEYRIEHKKGE